MTKKLREEIQMELDKYESWLSNNTEPYGDWKFIKWYEYKLRGKETPYSEEEMQDYFTKRDEFRAKIDELRAELGLDGTTPTGTHTDTDEPIIEPEPPIIEVD